MMNKWRKFLNLFTQKKIKNLKLIQKFFILLEFKAENMIMSEAKVLYTPLLIDENKFI